MLHIVHSLDHQHAATYIYIHTYIHTCCYIHLHTCIHTCCYIHLHTYIHAATYIHTCTYIHSYMSTYSTEFTCTGQGSLEQAIHRILISYNISQRYIDTGHTSVSYISQHSVGNLSSALPILRVLKTVL